MAGRSLSLFLFNKNTFVSTARKKGATTQPDTIFGIMGGLEVRLPRPPPHLPLVTPPLPVTWVPFGTCNYLEKRRFQAALPRQRVERPGVRKNTRIPVHGLHAPSIDAISL